MEGFGLFAGPIDLRVRSILDGPNVCCLSLTFGSHEAFVGVEGFGELICTLLQPITLPHQFRQLTSLLFNKTLAVSQSSFGDLTSLIRALRLLLGFSDRDFPELAFLRERRLSSQEGILLLHDCGLSQPPLLGPSQGARPR